MMVFPASSASRTSRFQGALHTAGPWPRLTLLVLLQVGLFALEWQLARQTSHQVSFVYVVPFFVGVFVLPLRQQLVLGASVSVLVLLTSLHADEVLPGDSHQRLLIRLFVIAICLWGSAQRQQLHRSNMLMHTIFRDSPVAKAVCLSHTGRIVMANPAMAQLLGIKHDQLPGRCWHAFSNPQTVANRRTIQIVQSATGPRHAEVITTPLGGAASTDALEIIQVLDREQHINDQRALKQQQSELQQTLQASLRSSALIHELRQPLALLLLQMRHLQSLNDSDLNQRCALIADLQTTGEQIETTINGMDALLSSANRRAPQAIDLSALLHSCMARVQEQLDLHHIECHYQEMAPPLIVPGDQRQLRIAIDNLLRNAIEALQHVNSRPRQLHVGVQQQLSHAVICIADNGGGLPSCDLTALQLLSSKPDGLGLGLYIARLVASNHRGTLTAGRNPQYGGAELRLSLALAEGSTPAAGHG